MAEEKNKGGRPHLTEAQKAERKEYLLQKLEPYLKSGLSVNKALCETKIHNSEFYKFMAEDEFFRDGVSRFRQYIAVLVNQAIVTELFAIVEKQNGNEAKNIDPQPLSKDDIKFLMWFALNSNLTKEEWGRRENINLYDPEAEIQRVKSILEEQTTKQILHIN